MRVLLGVGGAALVGAAEHVGVKVRLRPRQHAEEGSARLLEPPVAPHDALDLSLLPPDERAQDPAVLGKRPLHPAGEREHPEGILVKLLAQAIAHRAEAPATTGLEEHSVALHVKLDKFGDISTGRGVPELSRQRRETGEFRLSHPADRAHRSRALEDAEEHVDLLDLVERAVRDEDAASLCHDDEPFVGKLQERLANRRPTDPVSGADLALEDPHARLQAATQDLGLEEDVDLVLKGLQVKGLHRGANDISYIEVLSRSV